MLHVIRKTECSNSSWETYQELFLRKNATFCALNQQKEMSVRYLLKKLDITSNLASSTTVFSHSTSVLLLGY